jgi:hypothetical protein
MPNANSARLVRIVTSPLGHGVFGEGSLSTARNQFAVVVEGKSGRVLGASGQPYGLRILALDLTTGANPHSAANNFSQQRMERFDAEHGWPDKVATFTITLNDLLAVQGHLFRYHAILTSANQIISFVESPLFLLYLHDARLGVARAPADTTIKSGSQLFSGGASMTNANDADLQDLFVATDGSKVPDPSPNEAGGNAGNTFDLFLRAAAGEVIGNSGATYKLNITAFDVTAGVPVPGLNPFAAPNAEAFNAANNWVKTGDDFFKEEKYDITIPANVTRGNAFRYTASLIADNFQVVSTYQSALFVLV